MGTKDTRGSTQETKKEDKGLRQTRSTPTSGSAVGGTLYGFDDTVSLEKRSSILRTQLEDPLAHPHCGACAKQKEQCQMAGSSV